jgi:hypothetical protein
MRGSCASACQDVTENRRGPPKKTKAAVFTPRPRRTINCGCLELCGNQLWLLFRSGELRRFHDALFGALYGFKLGGVNLLR